MFKVLFKLIYWHWFKDCKIIKIKSWNCAIVEAPLGQRYTAWPCIGYYFMEELKLNKKGKKIIKYFEKFYGKKEGDKIFDLMIEEKKINGIKDKRFK